MKAYIYMNEQIRKPLPARPVIVFQVGQTVIETNLLRIKGPSVVKFNEHGLGAAIGHHVRAWIECDSADVVM